MGAFSRRWWDADAQRVCRHTSPPDFSPLVKDLHMGAIVQERLQALVV